MIDRFPYANEIAIDDRNAEEAEITGGSSSSSRMEPMKAGKFGLK
jgi:hypothetical protein